MAGPLRHNVYTTQIANSVIEWPTSEEHVLSQTDVDPLRRELPNRENQEECTQSSMSRVYAVMLVPLNTSSPSRTMCSSTNYWGKIPGTSQKTNYIIAFADLLWSLLNLAGYLVIPVVFILVLARFINGVFAWLRNRIPEGLRVCFVSHVRNCEPNTVLPASTTPPSLRSRA